MKVMSRVRRFTVEELFPILLIGKGNNTILSDGNDLPYLGAKKKDNGVMRYCANDPDLTFEGNCVAFICNGAGSVGYALYVDRPFIATSDIVVGYNPNLNPYIGLYLVSLFDLERPRFSYGRKWKKTLKQTSIPLPAKEDGEIDWKCIETFMKRTILPKLPSRAKDVFIHGVNSSKISPTSIDLTATNWEWFKYDDIFVIRKGTRLTKAEMEDGNINFIGATESNNGITALISNNTHIFPGNLITVSYNGSIAEAFYQKAPFWASDDINVLSLRNHSLNKYIAIFLITIIRIEKYRFSYGRKWDIEKMKNTMIKLPVTLVGTPDWHFMESYIKSLPFSKLI